MTLFSQQIKLTLWVVIVLSRLHSLADLHADDINFGLTVLQHLLGRLQHLLILIGAVTRQGANHNTGSRKVNTIQHKQRWNMLEDRSFFLSISSDSANCKAKKDHEGVNRHAVCLLSGSWVGWNVIKCPVYGPVFSMCKCECVICLKHCWVSVLYLCGSIGVDWDHVFNSLFDF